LPGVRGDRPGTGPDESRDETGSARRGPVALCGYCRRELPTQTGRARRFEYCPAGTGRHEDNPGAGTCKFLAAAQRRLRAARSTDVVPGAAEVLLGEHVTAVLDLAGPVAALRTDLTGVEATLAADVATMRAERDAARAAEREALGQAAADKRLRGIAEEQATAAYGKQVTAERAARAAEQA
jgi:hypothetical protein